MTQDVVAFVVQLCRQAAAEPEASASERHEAAATAERFQRLSPEQRAELAPRLQSMLEGPYEVGGRLVWP
jgi:hypothetical protein